MFKNNQQLMTEFHVDGDMTMTEIFENDDYSTQIFISALYEIRETYQDHEIEFIDVVKIHTKSKEYSIRLQRDQFSKILSASIEHFEKLEMYEKCQECLDILKVLESKI